MRCGEGRDKLQGVADTDSIIALRSNCSCHSQRIWSKFGEGEVALGRVIIARGRDLEPSMKLSRSYSNRRDVN